MTPEKAYLKCLHENRRVNKLESVIALDPWYSYYYARNIIKRRWKEGEKNIATDPECSYWYASYVINGRFEEGEKSISADPYYSYLYVHNVLKDSFELCHSTIFNSELKYEYLDFLKSINYDLNKISEWLL